MITILHIYNRIRCWSFVGWLRTYIFVLFHTQNTSFFFRWFCLFIFIFVVVVFKTVCYVFFGANSQYHTVSSFFSVERKNASNNKKKKKKSKMKCTEYKKSKPILKCKRSMAVLCCVCVCTVLCICILFELCAEPLNYSYMYNAYGSVSSCCCVSYLFFFYFYSVRSFVFIHWVSK